jgi:hypothetical protein
LIRVERERFVESQESVESDELDDPRGPSAAGALRRHEDVEVSHRSIPHVVDEADIAAQVIDVALITVEKDPERGSGGRGLRRRNLGSGDPRQGQQYHRDDSGDDARTRVAVDMDSAQPPKRGLTVAFDSDPKL